MDLTQTRGPWAQAFRVVPGLKRSARSLGSSVPHGPWAQAFRARGLCVLTTLCNFELLQDPTPINKSMNTYSGQINITHVGKLNLGGTLIYPVYYAPNGPRNLISSSQLEDHGNLYMGQLSEIKTANWLMTVSEPHPDTDYHIALGHPSDEYLRQFLKLHNITPSVPSQLAKNCEICKSCKLKRSPHSNPLPHTDRPFKTLHIDVLQISPPSKTKFKYVLVIIDDFSRFNRIYLLRHKNESESRILSYLLEIVNKTGKTPALIHTDRGGEFNSNTFRSKLLELGINIEVGPANSPQTNGLAERFNQTLLVKIRCLLAQSSVPLNFWDEAAKYSSSLINILPSKALNWSSPSRLHTYHSQILLQFVVISIKISDNACSPPLSRQSTPMLQVSSAPSPTPSLSPPRPDPPTGQSVTAIMPKKNPATKYYEYVPADKPPSKEICSDINTSNIVSASRRPHSSRNDLPPATDQPDNLYCLAFDGPDDKLLLNENVPVKKALQNSQELADSLFPRPKEESCSGDRSIKPVPAVRGGYTYIRGRPAGTICTCLPRRNPPAVGTFSGGLLDRLCHPAEENSSLPGGTESTGPPGKNLPRSGLEESSSASRLYHTTPYQRIAGSQLNQRHRATVGVTGLVPSILVGGGRVFSSLF
ncbi:hypothetical protein PCASD_24311 [Puccinia coronata f. sp. avenae]|uniref:Integrase catalytic domain-containing protein n=1 Tax=Puccinia coronata f. sp. avenae TaxID=200324 RepID=A0A2N5RZW4_9BASI|nr:hypothetical protein PCASD_24311 [Puccinia coronata f. sp. avenae]